MDAETRLSSVPANDTWAFCETLHALSAELTLTEAFNVAFWCEKDQTLHFPYQYDEGATVAPVILPIGDGPTSWVIRCKKTLVLTPDEKPPFQRSVYWGRNQRPSVSSVHLPMRGRNGGSDPLIVGVVAIHAYSRIRYTPDIVSTLEWLANRAGLTYHTQMALAEAEQAVAESALRLRDLQQSKTEMCNQVAHILHGLSSTAHQIAEGLQSSSNPQAPKVFDLSRRLYGTEAEITMLPTGMLSLKTAPEPLETQPGSFTPSEIGVVQGLLDGYSNKEIADRLHLSVATVKFHLHSIYQKIGTTSRGKTIHFLQSNRNPFT